jgi:hypothetical protein
MPVNLTHNLTDEEIALNLEKFEALESIKDGVVQVTFRIPLGAVLTRDNADIADCLEEMLERELDEIYPDRDKPEQDIGDNVTIALTTRFKQ